MADPKGTYYSPQSPETGWATVLPTQPHRSYANLLARELAGRKKAKDAEEQARQAALSKLKGVDVGKLHHRVYNDALDKFLGEAQNMNQFEIESKVLQLDAAAKATKDVAKIYDEGIKWAENKNNPVKRDMLRQKWASDFSNPSLETAAQWAETPPQITSFLNEEGGSQYIDANRAVKMVVKDNFAGFASDKSEWTRSGWENSPLGYKVADLTTLQTKVQAFSKYDKETGEVVMKDGTELMKDGILAPFEQNEFTNIVLEDEARKIVAERKGIKPEEVDPIDINQQDKANALSQILTPYVQGVVSERGMTLAIRPSGGGGGGGTKEQKFQKGFDLWIYQLSQGSPTAARFPAGGRIGQTNEEVVAFNALSDKQVTGVGGTARGGQISVLASPEAVRRNFEGQDWFKGLTAAQKTAIVNDTFTSGSSLVGKANVAYTVVTRTPRPKQAGATDIGATSGAPQYDYRVMVINPETADRATLRLLYDAGYGAGGNVHYDAIVGQSGEKQAGYEYEQAPFQFGEDKPANEPKKNPWQF